jgi:hypothetical protein
MFQRNSQPAPSPSSQASAERAARPSSYIVVMVRYPAQRASEAVVNPEYTRGKVTDLIARGEYGSVDDIEFIHEIHADGTYTDVTDELCDAAAELEAA